MKLKSRAQCAKSRRQVSTKMLLIWFFVVTLSAMILELIAGNLGLLLPVLGLASFYLVLVFGWPRVLPVALSAGIMMDLFLGRSLPVFLFTFPLISLAAAFWREHGECQAYVAQFLPGLLAGMICITTLISSENLRLEHLSLMLLWHNLQLLSISTIAAAIFLPALCRVLDAGAYRMGLSQYQHVQTEEAGSEER